MLEFLTLSCPSCGAPLHLSPGIERFSCDHCGRQLEVRRVGGTVTLDAVVQRIENVQLKLDKASSELAIRRLSDEISQLRAQLTIVATRRKTWGDYHATSILLSLAILGISLFLLYFTFSVGAIRWIPLSGIAIAAAVFIIVSLIERSNRAWFDSEKRVLTTAIARKQSEIAHYRRDLGL
jgi:hypothetical protein